MARTKSRQALVKEIEAAQAKLKAHDKAEAERLGTLAMKCGIGGIDISDEELTHEFQAIVARFREGASKVEESAPERSRSAGKAPEAVDDEAA